MAHPIASITYKNPPSHVVKFAQTGLTTSALTGLLAGDIAIRISAATTASLVTTANTLPYTPLSTDWNIVLRSA